MTLLQQIENYSIRLIAPQQLDDGEFQKFQTSLGPVLQFIKHSREKDRLDELVQKDLFKNLDHTAAMVINSCTNAQLRFEEARGAVNMCKALDDMREDARNEGIELGEQNALRTMANRLLLDGTLTIEKIAELTDLPVAELHTMKNA